MPTAIVGVGNIGRAVAGHLVAGGERVVLAASTRSSAEAVARDLGPLATAASVEGAIAQTDAVVLAVWFETMKELIPAHSTLLVERVVIDPSNPVALGDGGELHRTLPEGVSAASVIAGLLPQEAHYAKAFGTMSAQSLVGSARRTPRAVLFYATDDDQAARMVERLISTAGFDAVRAGGVKDALRIEMYGDLHDFGGLNGRVLDLEEARAVVGAAGV